MIRTVVDTNIAVSAFLWGGTPREILDAARREVITIFTSPALIAELDEVLSGPKFAARITRAGSSVSELLEDYRALARVVRPTAPQPVVRDPDDDMVIACPLTAKAEIIVSGDEDLLVLGSYQNVTILSATQMRSRLR